jgi:hypothetical protein
MLAFHVGRPDADHVRVTIARDNGDDWLSADVIIQVGAFRAKYAADFNSFSFSDFYTQLEVMDRTLVGAARFTSLEGQLELSLSCDVAGHIQVNGEAIDYVGTGNRLSFRIAIDQSYLPAILESLRMTVAQYPPRAV